MFWKPEKPWASTIGYARCTGGVVSCPVGQSVGVVRGTPPLPPTLSGGGADGALLQPRKQATMKFASTRFMAVRPPGRHLSAIDHTRQVPELIEFYTHC